MKCNFSFCRFTNCGVQCNKSGFRCQRSNDPLELILENNVDIPSTSSSSPNTEQNNTACSGVEETLLESPKTASLVNNKCIHSFL